MRIDRILPAIAATLGLSVYAGQQTIDIDFTKRGHDIAPSMYGLFFEEINHAGDGGLYAELIRNRGFEEHTVPGGMTYRNGQIYAPEAPSYFALDTLRWHAPWDMEALKSLQDENTLDYPEKIIPMSEPFDDFSKKFNYVLPPYSLTIFRFKAKL